MFYFHFSKSCLLANSKDFFYRENYLYVKFDLQLTRKERRRANFSLLKDRIILWCLLLYANARVPAKV